MGWPAQEAMERQLAAAVQDCGGEVRRARDYDPAAGHGFIASQKQGMAVFAALDPEQPIIVAEAIWQYSHHVLAGLSSHRGPILTVANWSGQWPGLVGMLNLNGSLTKAGIPYSTLWSETFADAPFRDKLAQWLADGRVTHDLSHVLPFDAEAAPDQAKELARSVAADLRRRDPGRGCRRHAPGDPGGDGGNEPCGPHRRTVARAALVSRRKIRRVPTHA